MYRAFYTNSFPYKASAFLYCDLAFGRLPHSKFLNFYRPNFCLNSTKQRECFNFSRYFKSILMVFTCLARSYSLDLVEIFLHVCVWGGGRDSMKHKVQKINFYFDAPSVTCSPVLVITITVKRVYLITFFECSLS